jgi:uncharacterized protein
MADDSLPTFRYHPDPIATGSIVESEYDCVCCGQRRGYIYTGPVYAIEEHVEDICPWCIASGDAHAKLDADFTDTVAIGGGAWDEVPAAVIEEIAFRTPGFAGWQQERWWTHCGDGAEFIGVEHVDPNGGPTTYRFRCRHCGAVGGYSDFT